MRVTFDSNVGERVVGPDLGTSERLEVQAVHDAIVASSRRGTLRPPELDDPNVMNPLTAEQGRNIWQLLQRIADVNSAIEDRGVGHAPLRDIAKRLRERGGLENGAWFDGLDQAADTTEKKIVRAFSEWADGDSVALHVAYEIDIYCTNDLAHGAGMSVFDAENRRLLSSVYGVRFMILAALAAAA